MLQSKLPASTAAAPSAKEDVRSLLLSIREILWGLADSRLTKWAAVASIVAVPIAIITFIAAQPPKEPPIPKSPLVHALEITEPPGGAQVGPAIDVRGTALLDGKKHHYYLIVTPPQGSAQIQADPMDFSVNGELYGRAVLGNRSVGAAKTFFIQIMACNGVPASLLQAPADCQRSKAVGVVRRY
jgi:hypothetical protein